MRHFFLVLLIVFLGASSALYLLASTSDDAVGFGGPAHAMLTVFRMLVFGDFATDEFVVGTEVNKWLIIVTFVVTMVLVSIVLLNLLIALLSDSYEKIQDRAYIEFQLARARIVVSHEKLFSVASLDNPILFPEYLHVKVERGKTDPKVAPTEWQ
jgi:hypothetical protein